MTVQNYRVKHRDVLDAIEESVGKAYELGYAHGSNPGRVTHGLPPCRTDEGWGQYSDALFALMIRLLETGKLYQRDAQQENIRNCPSTHGGAGYALGSYWDGDAIICGICGARIEQPAPTGSKAVPKMGFWNRLLGRLEYVPTWPEWIRR